MGFHGAEYCRPKPKYRRESRHFGPSPRRNLEVRLGASQAREAPRRFGFHKPLQRQSHDSGGFLDTGEFLGICEEIVGDEKVALDEAYKLGFGEPLRVSAEHGRGEADLRAAIAAALGEVPAVAESGVAKTASDPLCVCFIGRPNVGKSSLSNRLLKSDRLIVSDVPGTTRDAIELPFDFVGRDGKKYPFRLIDTAGIKAAAKLASPVEYFSRLRSLDAIKNTDVVFIVLDALEGFTQQDKAIAGEAIKESKPIVVVVNKWDLYAGEVPRKEWVEYLRETFRTMPWAPVEFTTAKSGRNVKAVIDTAQRLYRQSSTRIPTSKLNQIVRDAIEAGEVESDHVDRLLAGGGLRRELEELLTAHGRGRGT